MNFFRKTQEKSRKSTFENGNGYAKEPDGEKIRK
jgi:hypothetical protein